MWYEVVIAATPRPPRVIRGEEDHLYVRICTGGELLRFGEVAGGDHVHIHIPHRTALCVSGDA